MKAEVPMETVNLSAELGLVVRRAALEQRGLSYRKLLDATETEAPLGANDDLLSFAGRALTRRGFAP